MLYGNQVHAVNANDTALLLIGFQNDYLSPEGVLYSIIEQRSAARQILPNTLALIEAIADTPVPIISTPISFSCDYTELVDPVGVLKTVKDVGAFQNGSIGAQTVPELYQYQERIIELPGKRSLNAFSDTQLDDVLKARAIRNLVIAGVVTSVCIDSTGRASVERGYHTAIISDCTCGRTQFEQDFYCDKVFPLYANVFDHKTLAKQLQQGRGVLSPTTKGSFEPLVHQRLFEELSAAETRYRELVDNLHNIVFRYDNQGLLLFVNPAWEALLGFATNETLGQSLDHFILEEDKALWQTLHELAEIGRQELRLKTADGRILWFDLSVCPNKGRDGIGLLYETTVKKQEQQRLQQTVEVTENATREKSHFLATMSHEIRTPMNGVIGMTDLLWETQLDNTQRQYLQTLKKSGDALLALIDDVLDFSKIEAGKLQLENEPLSIRRLVEEVVNLFFAKAQQKGLSVQYSVAPQVPPVIYGDVYRLRQIFSNLISNAIKFTACGEIKITVCWQEKNQQTLHDCLRVGVADTGIGIDADLKELLFKPFSQADSSITRSYGGTGLGLTICARLLELMSGKIWFEDTDVGGTAFYFEFPTREAVAVAEGQITAETEHFLDNQNLAESLPLTILVAENEAANRDIIGSMLTTMGYAVDIVENGLQALEYTRIKRYDLILMDIHMPEMDGLEACRALLDEAEPERRPIVIAFTADVTSSNRDQCLASGMSDILTKPVRMSCLKLALQRVSHYQAQERSTASGL
ncbi:MAG: isochorismatase family protein [Cellvibrionaceae bacterium]|nr:isochorismatase family protein [Cellvibrionaceae bacterium]